MIIEWNAHMFSADTTRYPFHPQAVYTPAADQFSADPLGDYIARLDQYGIDRAVLVHPEPYGDDHRFTIHAPPGGGFTVTIEIPYEPFVEPEAEGAAPAKPTAPSTVKDAPGQRALGTIT